MGKSRKRRRSHSRSWIRRNGKYLALVVAGAVATFFVVLAITPPAQVQAGPAPRSSDATTPAPDALTLAEKLAGTEAVNLVVVGDSTGYQDGQWVVTMAADLSAKYNRATDVARWNKDTLAYDAPVRIGTGTGAALTIWNGSATGQAPVYSQTNLGGLVPVENADMIIVNHGHNTGPDPVLDIGRLTTKITTNYPGVPLAVTVQNPSLTQDPADYAVSSATIREWITAQSGWVLIDAYTAFTTQPDLAALYIDKRHPNEAGGRVWADAAEAALGI